MLERYPRLFCDIKILDAFHSADVFTEATNQKEGEQRNGKAASNAYWQVFFLAALIFIEGEQIRFMQARLC